MQWNILPLNVGTHFKYIIIWPTSNLIKETYSGRLITEDIQWILTLCFNSHFWKPVVLPQFLQLIHSDYNDVLLYPQKQVFDLVIGRFLKKFNGNELLAAKYTNIIGCWTSTTEPETHLWLVLTHAHGECQAQQNKPYW